MSTLRRIIQYSTPYWGRILIAVLASVATGGMDGAFAYLVEPLLKKMFATHDTTIFAFLPFGVLLIFFLRAACRFLNDYYMRTAGELAVVDIRNEVYQKIIRLDMRYYNTNKTGGMMSRVMSDVGGMQSGIANVVTNIFRDGISAASLLGVLFYRNWMLAIIAFVAIPLTAYPAQIIGKRIKKLANQGQLKMADLASHLQETFSGIKVIKAFGLEKRSSEMFEVVTAEFYLLVRKSIKYGSISAPMTEMITSFGIATVIWSGGSMVMKGTMSTAEFFSFITAMLLVYKPLKSLNGAYNTIQSSLGAAIRVFEIIDMKPDISDAPNALPLKSCNGIVEFKNVSFSYNDNYVLKDVSLRAERNQIIALVGPSGGGKSTLVSLIPRFYDINEGTILIDDKDIRLIRIQDLVEQIALVDQETVLFNDTIANNIRYGNFSASDAEVEAAAKAAFAHDFITDMPDGYSTYIGDRGTRLSGGQRQRICIARALIKNAPILILDEATSALDTESERMVQKALDNLMTNRTTFVIAHRLSTVLHADKILVIENGSIIESGAHEELIKNGGLYSRLCSMQLTNNASNESGTEP
ncbi:MAG: ABC transporter ATP-binding protein [Desulfuromonadaceae bacterium]|nr:ABC transporter ATP-binding protein [Desulfuromonadaceae bacterium]MDD2854380.1 ABC transporter ATP-binding protein [Desulfuromonadaceae bacterium]